MDFQQKIVLEPNFWVERYADAMLHFAFKRTNDLTLSEDLVQETFLSALKARDGFQGKSQEKTWLYSILEHKIADYFRSSTYNFHKQTTTIESNFVEQFFDQENGHWKNGQKPQTWKEPNQPEEFDKAVQNCLKKLPQKLASIFTYKYLEEGDAATICKDLGISTSNYWVMMHRAKLQLRACLQINWLKL
jgi:RNA polymerase sigma-70 factor (TIGR02943 family)